jgi:hypothetical protein
MNKTDLIKTIVTEHRKLEDALATIKADRMETSASENIWTVKETLVHITHWEQVLLADHARLVRGESIHELVDDEEMNTLNAEVRLHAKTIPLVQVLDEFNSSFRQLINWLEKLDEAELRSPFAYGMSLGEFIEEDTWKHYGEHLHLLTTINIK